MYKLVLTDLDNTLIPFGAPHASDRALASIHALLDAGVRFGPVSGRVPAAMRWMFNGDAACCQTGAFVNGQLLYVDGNLVCEKTLDADALQDLASIVGERENVALTIYDLRDVTEAADGRPYFFGTSADELARNPEVFGTNIHLRERVADLPIPACVKSNLRCSLPPGEVVALRDELREAIPALDFVLPMTGGSFIDVLPAGWDKGRGVVELAERVGVELSEVAVFGDSDNDLAMLRAVPNSYAVANASDEALAAARYHIGRADEDAVADAFFAIAEQARGLLAPKGVLP